MVVTTADIYRQLLDLTQAVGRLDGSVQALTQRVSLLDDHESRLRVLEGYGTHDHNTRLAVLERSRWPLPSLAALVGLAGLVLALWSLAKNQ